MSNTTANAYAVNTGDTAWVLTPGLGFFYAGGTVSPRNVMHTIMSSMWYFWGYTLAFSDTGSKFIGDFKWIGLHGVNTGEPHPMAPTIPNMAYCMFQLMFATVTPAIVFSGAAERIKMLPYMIFVLIWGTVVYDFIAYWAWAQNGWFRQIGGLDYAGGMAVETASGFASLGLARALGRRKKQESDINNAPFIVLGTAFLWFGWIGFNAGSALGANQRAAAAAMNTHFTACIAGGVWMVCHYLHTKKWSVVAVCEGAVAGLVCATPAAGYIDIHSCLAFGFVSGTVCFFATHLNKLLKVDDTFMAFACHGTAGFLGMLLTGIFADKDIIRTDGVTCTYNDTPLCQPGGWVNRRFIQLAIQLAGASAAAGWAFFWSYSVVRVLRWAGIIPLKEKAEDGLDLKVLGEEGYSFVSKAVTMTPVCAPATTAGAKPSEVPVASEGTTAGPEVVVSSEVPVASEGVTPGPEVVVQVDRKESDAQAVASAAP
eukprot:m51a1_g14213 putative ammonium transporter (484) ;mRNA; r:169484-171492